MFFEKKVDLRSRRSMIGFLEEHFRYPTMNHWNGSESYANVVKVYKLGLPADAEENMFNVLDNVVLFDLIHGLIKSWEVERDYRWQVGFNGRSSGYMVLYQGGYNVRERPDGTTFFESYCKPGRGLDDDEINWDEWSLGELRERVRLVQSFDRLCDSCRDVFIDFCQGFDGV